MDIFDKIAAALSSLASGTPKTDPDLQAHIAQIDEHLKTLDDAEGTDASNAKSVADRLDAIDVGLAKIAAAVSPAPAEPASDGSPPNLGSGMPEADPGSVPASGV